MSLLKSSAQQRQVLILGFTLLFSVSFVIIVFERAQTPMTAEDLNPAAPLAVNAVRGDEIIRDQAIAHYHSQARQVAMLLFSNITKLEQGQIPSLDELVAARQSIVSMTVPAVYQKLHFKLLKILNKLEVEGGADLRYLTEQSALLQAEFPWL